MGDYRGSRYGLTERGKRLDTLLRDADMSVSSLATYLGVDRKTIYGFMHESSDTRLNLVRSIADFFSVSIDWLVGL